MLEDAALDITSTNVWNKNYSRTLAVMCESNQEWGKKTANSGGYGWSFVGSQIFPNPNEGAKLRLALGIIGNKPS